MNGAFVHLALNHIPVLGTPFAFLLLLGGRFRQSEELTRAGLVALVAVAILTIPAFKSGPAAAHVLKVTNADINWPSVHEHAEAAEFGFWAAEILGVLALASLFFYRRLGGLPLIPFAVVMIAASLFVSVVMARVAHLGGLIRHPEISPISQAPTAQAAPQKDDDD